MVSCALCELLEFHLEIVLQAAASSPNPVIYYSANDEPEFGRRMTQVLSAMTGLELLEARNHFAAQASMDTATDLSSHLKTMATALMKIANDLRWMNSGPIAGLGEVMLPALQPGSSIMPGKVNPVICEVVMMVAAQVMGNDLAVSIGNQHGNFELNVMLPMIAHNLLQSIMLLANAAHLLADEAIAGMTINIQPMAASRKPSASSSCSLKRRAAHTGFVRNSEWRKE